MTVCEPSAFRVAPSEPIGPLSVAPTARHGFTLVELLVVVTIIIALLAVLAPATGRAVQLAQTAHCRSNQHQLSIAMLSYVTEYRNFPGHHWISPIKMAWPVRIRPYTDLNQDLYFCPSNDDKFRWPVTYKQGAQLLPDGYYVGETVLNSTHGFSYGYNDWGIKDYGDPHLGLGGHVNQPQHMARGIGSVVQPSDMIAIADSYSDFYWDFNIDPTPSLLGVNGETDQPGRRHDDGANVVFVDGHVSWMSFQELMAKDYESTPRWNTDHLPHPEYWAY